MSEPVVEVRVKICTFLYFNFDFPCVFCGFFDPVSLFSVSQVGEIKVYLCTLFFFLWLLGVATAPPPPPEKPKKKASGLSYREFRRIAREQAVCDTSDFEKALIASIQHQQSGNSTSCYATAVQKSLLPNGPW